jgi:hypothetical protein
VAAIDNLADPERYPGISANLCESLLMLRPEGQRSSLGVAVTWSRAFMPEPPEARRVVRLDQEVFDVAAGLGARLRSLPGPRVDRFFGFVQELRGQPTPHDPRPSGEVRFSLLDKEEEEIIARADLNAEDYAVAGEAHLASDPVKFKGILYRLPRLNRIEQIADFARFLFDEGS